MTHRENNPKDLKTKIHFEALFAYLLEQLLISRGQSWGQQSRNKEV